MKRGSVSRAIFEAIDKVAGQDADEKDEKPPAGPEGDDAEKDEEPKGSERRGARGEGPDAGAGFAPDANMTIKDGDAEGEPGEDSKRAVFDFIVGKRGPDDAAVHAFAGELGVEPDELEGLVYSILGSLAAGKSVAAGLRSENVDPGELKKGIAVEKEHTDLPFLAERIAMDHLAEIPDYYTRLDKMEKEAKAAGSAADVDVGKPDADDARPWPRSPTSWPNAPEKKKSDDEDDDDEGEVTLEPGKRAPYHSMDVHDGEGEDDGW